MNTVKMYGPSISDPTKIVNRDVPLVDVGVYERAGYQVGSLPETFEPEVEPVKEPKPKAKAKK